MVRPYAPFHGGYAYPGYGYPGYGGYGYRGYGAYGAYGGYGYRGYGGYARTITIAAGVEQAECFTWNITSHTCATD